MKKPLIVLTGPTAVGKTELSIALAKAVGGEIISADSMQVYRGMDIGTAKISKAQMQNIPHYLIDILDPTESFDVVCFQNLAKEALNTIYSHGHIPILTGGTGFYIQALLYDIDFTENDEDLAYREALTKTAAVKGSAYLHELLRTLDEKAAQAIHPNNLKRIIRAMEFYKQTGTCISEHNETQRQKKSPYCFTYFVLNDKREQLYNNIDKRVDTMLRIGLADEVKHLKQIGCRRDLVSMQGLGYKEIFAYLEGECTLEEACCIIKRDTRHFAKRQLTWFRREKEVIWINKEEYDNDNARILKAMCSLIKKT